MGGQINAKVPNQTSMKLYRVNMPVCVPEFQSLLSQKFENNSMSEIIRNASLLVQSGDRIFMLQDGRLLVGDIVTMLFPTEVRVGSAVRDMQPFASSVLLSCSDGFYFVNRKFDTEIVGSANLKSHVTKKMTHGGGVVWGITEADEVFSCVLVVEPDSAPYPQIVPISGNIDAVLWGDSPQMIYCAGTLFISNGEDLYVFRGGAWTRHRFGGHKIVKLAKMSDRLVIAFDNSKFIYDVPLVRLPEDNGGIS